MEGHRRIEGHKRIEDHAAALLARRDSGTWTSHDEAELRAWTAEATAHRVALLRFQAAWQAARRLKALSPVQERGTVPPPAAWRETPFLDCARRDSQNLVRAVPLRELAAKISSHARSCALAAAGLLAVAIGAYLYLTGTFLSDRYATPIGGVTSVALRDGSSVTLNTSSAVHVAFSSAERRIDLEQGEAFFAVAKDLGRPFVVHVGDKQVVAVGTKFSVRRDDDNIRVIVTEGSVVLRWRQGPPAPSLGSVQESVSNARGERVAENWNAEQINAGMIAQFIGGRLQVQQTSLTLAADALSWREGFLMFEGATLADVVAQVNRYNTHKIRIADPQLNTVMIVGVLPTNYKAVGRIFEGLSIHASDSGEETELTVGSNALAGCRQIKDLLRQELAGKAGHEQHHEVGLVAGCSGAARSTYPGAPP